MRKRKVKGFTPVPDKEGEILIAFKFRVFDHGGAGERRIFASKVLDELRLHYPAVSLESINNKKKVQ